MGEYLRDARAEGQVEATERPFTIAKDKALDKLAHFALPGPFDWVLKIVQAANAWECECLVIAQTRIATSFYMQPKEDKFPQDQELVSALQHGSLETAGGVHELCLALRTLVDQARLSFVLALRKDGELGAPITFGADVDQLSEQERQDWADLDVDGLRLTVSHFQEGESTKGRFLPTFNQVERRDIEIVKVLEKRAYLSPCPIFVDGRDLTNPYHHPRLGQDLVHRPLALGFLNLDKSEEVEWDITGIHSNIAALRRPKKLSQPKQSWCLLRCHEWYQYSEQDSLADVLTSEVKMDHSHHFQWLRYGVIAHWQALRKRRERTTLFVIIPGRELRTDLTGLSLRLDDQEKQHLSTLCERIRSSLPQLSEKLEYLASDVSTDAKLAFQAPHTVQPKAMKGLKAGDSLLTTSVSYESSPGLKMLSRGYLKYSKWLNRGELVRRWTSGVKGDLKTIGRSLKELTDEES